MNQQMKDRIVEWLQENDEKLGGVIFFVDEPMSKHTTFQIGGNADVFICPQNRVQLEAIYKLQYELQFPIYTIGQGSNILVPDEGVRGVVVKPDYSEIKLEGNTITASAGVALMDLSSEALSYGLTGLEFASGIPGSLGGAIFMNAGAYGGNISDVVREVTVFTKDGVIKTLTNDELNFAYRQCVIQKTKDIILDVTIDLEQGDKNKIQEVIDDLTERRQSKQPWNMPSAGSVFKRPEGYYAGQLIDEAGLRGLSYGGAQVSDKHCGFIVNKGNATAHDVMELVSIIQKVVYDKFGIMLERELRMLGE